MRVKNARLRYTGAWLLLSIGALCATVADAEAGVWKSVGPYGGPVNAIAIDPSTPTTLYAGMSAGVFKSIDSGATWAAANTGLTFKISALAINPTTPAILYAGAGGGVFKSTDAGGTWAKASAGLNNEDVLVLAINPTTPSTLYAGTYARGVFKSTDSGATWTAVNTGITPYYGSIYSTTLGIDPKTPSTLYVGTSVNGVFKSTDAGATWTAANTGITADNGTIFPTALAIDPATPSTIYAATSIHGIFKSTDSGATWSADRPRRHGAGALHQRTAAHESGSELRDGEAVLHRIDRLGHGRCAGDRSCRPAGRLPRRHLVPQSPRAFPFRPPGNQGGTLLLSAPAAGVRATVRTSADTVAPQPVGRAGLAYTDTDPTASSRSTKRSSTA